MIVIVVTCDSVCFIFILYARAHVKVVGQFTLHVTRVSVASSDCDWFLRLGRWYGSVSSPLLFTHSIFPSLKNILQMPILYVKNIGQ